MPIPGTQVCTVCHTGAPPAFQAFLDIAKSPSDALFDMVRGELHTSVSDTELEGRLTDLYRASRLAFEEGGANILYIFYISASAF